MYNIAKMYPDCANITTKQGGQQKDVTPVRQHRDIVFTQTPATVHVNTLNSNDRGRVATSGIQRDIVVTRTSATMHVNSNDRRRATTSGKYINIIFTSRTLLMYMEIFHNILVLQQTDVMQH